jgi:MFS family permease
MLTVANNSMIKEVFHEEKKRSLAMGFYTASIAIVAILVMNISSFFAAETGNYFDAFKVFYFSIPILALLFLLPKGEVSKEEIVNEEKEIISLNKQVFKDGWKLWLSLGLIQVLYQTCFQFPGYFIVAKGIATSYIAPLISFVFVGVVASGFVFGLIYNKIKLRVPLLNYIIATISLALLFFSTNVVLLAIGMFGIGFVYCSTNAYSFLRSGLINKFTATNILLTSITMGIFAFLSPHIFNLLIAITGLNHLTVLPIVIAITAIGAVLSYFVNKPKNVQVTQIV